MREKKLIALVTGANRGIGYETVRQLAQQGITVYLGARSRYAAEEAARHLQQEGLQDVIPIQLDVTSPADRAAVAELIELRSGRLDVLVNNAAAIPKDATLLDAMTADTTEEELADAFRTNVFGVLFLVKALLPLLKSSEAGRIVNVSSTLGSLALHDRNDPEVAYTKRFAYNASKAALNLLTIQLAQELGDTSIKVNSVHPGWVKTKLGTEYAQLEVADGAKASLEAALLPQDGPTGKFLRQGGASIPW